jgi:hypothetical protein
MKLRMQQPSEAVGKNHKIYEIHERGRVGARGNQYDPHGTAEPAEDGEVAAPRPSVNRPASAVFPALAPRWGSTPTSFDYSHVERPHRIAGDIPPAAQGTNSLHNRIFIANPPVGIRFPV